MQLKNVEKFKTEQEDFWFGDFGTSYIDRNSSEKLLASNLNFFSRALASTTRISSCIEFGANIGMNLHALKLLFPNMQQYGIEINPEASKLLTKFIGDDNVFSGSLFDYQIHQAVDLTLTKGVLIHINPEMLNLVYKKLYDASNRYILICEYYNPSPISITYRGHQNRLFKRDFCGEMMALFSDLQLLDYGFTYKHDSNFPQDDITWFLMRKGNELC